MKLTRWFAIVLIAFAGCTSTTPEMAVINGAADALGGSDRILAVNTLVLEGTGENGNFPPGRPCSRPPPRRSSPTFARLRIERASSNIARPLGAGRSPGSPPLTIITIRSIGSSRSTIALASPSGAAGTYRPTTSSASSGMSEAPSDRDQMRRSPGSRATDMWPGSARSTELRIRRPAALMSGTMSEEMRMVLPRPRITDASR